MYFVYFILVVLLFSCDCNRKNLKSSHFCYDFKSSPCSNELPYSEAAAIWEGYYDSNGCRYRGEWVNYMKNPNFPGLAVSQDTVAIKNFLSKYAHLTNVQLTCYSCKEPKYVIERAKQTLQMLRFALNDYTTIQDYYSCIAKDTGTPFIELYMERITKLLERKYYPKTVQNFDKVFCQEDFKERVARSLPYIIPLYNNDIGRSAITFFNLSNRSCFMQQAERQYVENRCNNGTCSAKVEILTDPFTVGPFSSFTDEHPHYYTETCDLMGPCMYWINYSFCDSIANSNSMCSDTIPVMLKNEM